MIQTGIQSQYTEMTEMQENYDIESISKGNIKLTEYSNPDTGEVEKTYIQNGILGFWISDQEIKDLYLLLSYYINIEEISNIK